MSPAQISRFATDLRVAFASLQDAPEAHATAAPAPSLPFLNDLPLVYSEAARQLPGVYDPPEEDLYALANAFTRWRKAELARLIVA